MNDHRSDPEPATRRRAKATAKAADVERVIAAWESASGTAGHARDTALATAITTAINVAGVEKVVAAVRGIWSDEWWAARRPKLTQAIRNAETIERFAALAPGPTVDIAGALARFEALRLEGLALVRAAGDPQPTRMKYPVPCRGVVEIDGIHLPRFEDAALDFAAQDVAASVRAFRAMTREALPPRVRAELNACLVRVRADFDTMLADTVRRGAAA